MPNRIKDYIRKDIVTVDAEASVAVASKTMMENSVGSSSYMGHSLCGTLPNISKSMKTELQEK